MKKLSVLVLLAAMAGCGMVPSIPVVGDSDAPEKQTYVDLRPQPTLQIPEDLKQSELGQCRLCRKLARNETLRFTQTGHPCPTQSMRRTIVTKCVCSVWVIEIGW